MKTTKYTAARISIQVLTVIAIITNIAMGIYLYISDIDKVESLLTTKPLVMFFDIGLAITAMSVLYTLISACCITSKIKIVMKLYEKILYTQIGFVLAAAIYFRFFYINSVISSLSSEFIPSNAGFTALLTSYNLVPVNGSLITAFGLYLERIIDVFCIVQIIIAVLAYTQGKILRYTSQIELEKPDEEIPSVVNAKDLGSFHAMTYKMPMAAGMVMS